MKIIVNDEIDLRLFNEDLIPDFFESIHLVKDDSDEYRCNLQRKYKTIDDLKVSIVDAIENKYNLDGTPDFFIFFKGNLAGIFEFHPLTEKDHIEVGYWLYPEYRQKGIVSSVFPKMLDYAKKYFSKPKILATTSITNVPSQKLLEKLQFKKTGRILSFKRNGKEEVKEFEYILPLLSSV